MNEAPPRRPGGLARLACLLAAGLGYFEIFSIGFPPASRDRLPVLALSGALALVTAWDRRRGLIVFAFLFPLAGLGDRLAGGADAVAWPVLLFLGLAGGWTFRFLYDFESAPDPSRADRVLRGLLVLWTLAAALAVVRARTLWAILRGLNLRTVNVVGLTDAAAMRGSLLSLAALLAGAAFFFVLRRSGRADRDATLLAAVAGVTASAAIAVAERFGALTTETSSYWKFTGRLSGGAVDPNALGILCACAAPVAAALAASAKGRRRGAAALTLPVLAAGLVLSGSRSGLALAALGLLALLLARSLAARARFVVVLAAALLVAGVAVSRLSRPRSGAGARVADIFDAGLPVDFRVSSRTVLWENAVRAFERHPLEGAGLGAFSWLLPNLLAEQGRALPMSDNPGNAYLQALAETGVIGFAWTVLFALAVGREAVAAIRDPERPTAAGAGAALLGFLAALLTGSHWFSPDAALAFFLLAAVAARPAIAAASPWPARIRRLALAAYAAIAAWSSLATLDAGEAFRYSRQIGFHEREVEPGGAAFRWTRRRFALRLGAGETMRLGLAHYTPEGRDVVLTASAAGAEAFERTLVPGQGIQLRLSAPPKAARVFLFSLSRAFVPRRVGHSDDRRELGVVALFDSRP